MKRFNSAKFITENKHGKIINEAGIKSLSEDESFGAAGTDKRTGQVIGDILQLIKSTGVDPEDVIEAIEQEFKITKGSADFLANTNNNLGSSDFLGRD